MSFQVQGKILRVPSQITRGKNILQPFVIVFGQFHKELYLEAFGDKIIEASKLKPGQDITVFFNLQSFEFNGKYYTNAQAWKWEVK